MAGALSIIRKNRIDPDRIKDIRLRTFAAAARLPNDHPKNTEEAQYNLAYPVAAAILDGEVGPVQVLPPRLHDRRLLQLLDRLRDDERVGGVAGRHPVESITVRLWRTSVRCPHSLWTGSGSAHRVFPRPLWARKHSMARKHSDGGRRVGWVEVVVASGPRMVTLRLTWAGLPVLGLKMWWIRTPSRMK